LRSCVQAQDVLDECQKISPVSCDNIDLVNDISDELAEQGSRNASAKELRTILKSSYFRVWFNHFWQFEIIHVLACFWTSE